MKRTLKIQPEQFRAGESDADNAKGHVRLSISSEEPYLRYDWANDTEYYEILGHGPEDIDTSRMEAGASLLYNHNRDVILGRILDFEVTDGKAHVEAVISDAPDVKSHRIKIEEGILCDASVGYAVASEGQYMGKKDGIPLIKFRWAPYEASLVSVPADFTVGIGRAREMARQRKAEHGEPRRLMSVSIFDRMPPPRPMLSKRSAAVCADAARIDAYAYSFNGTIFGERALEIADGCKTRGASFDQTRDLMIATLRALGQLHQGTAITAAEFAALRPEEQTTFLGHGGRISG